jgi:hypothetical protein
MAVIIQLRGDTAANWTAENPVLAEREMALETDTDQFKVGDGVTEWDDLPYGGIQGTAGTPGATGPVIGTVDGGVPTTLYSTDADPLDGGAP